ncbi:DUF4040 domain-containing protein [SAR202 cluster bacterium AD-804-J14_MRT_500m]|nr:DUF4040 domain-containing protein [SAR202 cluster bacterium AD-804-J14_MRT_500m]
MILLFFALPAGAGILASLLTSRYQRYMGWGCGALMIALFGLALSQVPRISGGHPVVFSYQWVDELGVQFSFLLDGFSLLFVLLITAMGALIFFYSQEYMQKHPNSLKFYAWMLVFSGAMLGLVTASNLVVIYLFWEMTTISSFFLIGLTDQEEESRFNALQAMIVTTLGSLAMLAGFIILYQIFNTLEIAEIWARASELHGSSLAVPAAALIIIGVVAKSALMPFHIWLPSAMVAPTPVSAYLHSATMVTAGVFLVARLTPLFVGLNSWEVPIVTLGMGTLLIAGLLALRQQDLKALLAYSTVSQLGMMMALYALGTEVAALAASLHMLSHAVFKGGMFLVVGAIEHGVGTRDLRRLGGLISVMPVLGVIATLLALSSAGIPPLIGFVSKEALLEATLYAPGANGWLLPLLLAIGSVLTVAYSLKFLIGVFYGKARDSEINYHRIPLGLIVPPAFLAVVSVVFGIYPQMLTDTITIPAIRAVTQQDVHLYVALWHGLGLPLWISLGVISGGIVLFLNMSHLNDGLSPILLRKPVVTTYSRFVDLVNEPLIRLYRRVQHGDLRGYIVTIVIVTIVLVSFALMRSQTLLFKNLVDDVDLEVMDYGLAVLLMFSAIALAYRRTRLEGVFNLGLVGMLVVATFALYSAPDLALTLIVVEILTVVLFMLGLRKMLGMFNVDYRLSVRTLQILPSITFGAMVTLLVLWVLTTPQHSSIAPFFIENTEKIAHSKNVVNTILIDFRGFDTLGEITVIALAAIGVFAIAQAAKERG